MIKSSLKPKWNKLEDELEKQAKLNCNLNSRIKVLEYHLTKWISGLKKKKLKSKKRKLAIHHQRGYSDTVHNPINYTLISHHKRGSSGSGSSGNQWMKILQTENFDEGIEALNSLTQTIDHRHKNSYDGTSSKFASDGNGKQESNTKHVVKTKVQPSQAAIVTTTTTITTTPLQNFVNAKHSSSTPVAQRKRYYENVTQKRRWMIREFNKSRDLSSSEFK